MQATKLFSIKKLITYLTNKGTFAKKLSATQWKIKGNKSVYSDVAVVIEKRTTNGTKDNHVWFSCNKPAVEEFYADEFKRFQEKKL